MHIEPLHRGLVTSRDSSLLNEGELVYAQNVRYRPGDPALLAAEGHLQLPDHAFDGTLPVINVAWDDAPPMFIYARPDATLRYVPAEIDPLTESMFDANSAAAVAIDAVAAHYIGPGRPEVVHFEGQHILLDGGRPRLISLDDVAPAFSFLGMPRNDTPVLVAHINVTGAIPAGWYHYWFTWYSSVTGFEREGTTSVDAVGKIQLTSAKNNLRIFIKRDDFTVAKPDWADRIIIYRAPVQNNEFPGPWPAGYKVTDSIAISSFTVTQGSALLAAGYAGATIDAAADYFVLLIDSQSGTTLGGTIPFPIVAISADGIASSIGQNGNPPRATTGDVFEESLLMNDINDKRKARYSMVGEPGKVPDLYYINFDTRELDEVITIRTLGRVAGAFLRNGVWRINWLPRSGDSEFGQNRVKELVVEGFGVVGPNLVASFTMPQGPALAWYGPRGPYVTDLNDWSELAPQVDWTAIAGTPVALLNNINAYRLEIYFVGPDGTGFIYYLHYHATHIVDGHLAVTGPIMPRPTLKSAFTAIVGSTHQSVSLDDRGGIYYEGLPDATVVAAFRTREIYLNGAGREFRTNRVLLHGAVAQNVATFEVHTQPGGSAVEGFIDMGVSRLAPHAVTTNGEFVQLGVNNNGLGALKINWVGVEWESLGEVER